MEFTSRSDDKTPRWIITDGCSEPSLISRLKEEKEKEEVKGEGEGETEEGREDNISKGKGEIEGNRVCGRQHETLTQMHFISTTCVCFTTCYIMDGLDI